MLSLIVWSPLVGALIVLMTPKEKVRAIHAELKRALDALTRATPS